MPYTAARPSTAVPLVLGLTVGLAAGAAGGWFARESAAPKPVAAPVAEAKPTVAPPPVEKPKPAPAPKPVAPPVEKPRETETLPTPERTVKGTLNSTSARVGLVGSFGTPDIDHTVFIDRVLDGQTAVLRVNQTIYFPHNGKSQTSVAYFIAEKFPTANYVDDARVDNRQEKWVVCGTRKIDGQTMWVVQPAE